MHRHATGTSHSISTVFLSLHRGFPRSLFLRCFSHAYCQVTHMRLVILRIHDFHANFLSQLIIRWLLPSLLLIGIFAGDVGLEPTTSRLTAACSTNWANPQNKHTRTCFHFCPTATHFPGLLGVHSSGRGIRTPVIRLMRPSWSLSSPSRNVFNKWWLSSTKRLYPKQLKLLILYEIFGSISSFSSGSETWTRDLYFIRVLL